ncbi:MAG: hypothetical protein Q9160_004807 [Pyrenula sp. 1 TL-2023]
MEASPLTLQSRPEKFQPKIVQLYQHLFEHGHEDAPSEGFWQEFFLLPPDRHSLSDLLESLSVDDLLRFQVQTQALFTRAVGEVTSSRSPRNQNALEVGLSFLSKVCPTDLQRGQTLTTFLGGILTKRFTNPSSDIFEVLAGLDDADKVFSDLASGLDDIIRHEGDFALRSKAIETALSITAGAYQTGIVSYFIHRDLFPSLMKVSDGECDAMGSFLTVQQFIHDSDRPESTFYPFLLLGLLANYNKFEFRNPYQLRFEDFVNEATIELLVRGVGSICSQARDAYISIFDDLPEGWNLNSTLVFLGLRVLAPEAKARKAPPTEDEARSLFSALPDTFATIVLPNYTFTSSNKIFASALVSMPSSQASKESPFSAYLSLTSYLTHHAHRSQRCAQYAILQLLTVRALVEDPVIAKQLYSADHRLAVRLCRQRPPYLPVVSNLRTPASAVLDICTDTLSHNLRRQLDLELYGLVIGIILRVIVSLSHTKTRLQHHWPYLWGSLLSLIRFLTQYANGLSSLPNIKDDICTPLSKLVAFCLSAGDSFLLGTEAYDDLFYKLIETNTSFSKFRDAYDLQAAEHPIHTLISVSSHYHALLKEQHGERRRHQSPLEVQSVIKQGYQTLNIESRVDFGQWEKWRESSRKPELKRMIRTVVEDAKKVIQ